MILQDVIKEFALIPAREGVLKNFDRFSSVHPGYQALKDEIQNATTEPVLPDVTDFVFGFNPEAANNHLRNISGPFMLVDYGIFKGQNILQDGGQSLRFIFSVIMAMPPNGRNHDPVEDMLWSDTLLEYARTMLRHFEAQDKERCTTKRMLDGDVTIAPVEPQILLNCVGWDVSFSRDASEIMQ